MLFGFFLIFTGTRFMKAQCISEWDALVEQAILDIQENLISRKDLTQEARDSILPFLNSEIIEEISLERNWNNLCGNISCKKYRRQVAKVGENLCRTWFCSVECYQSIQKYLRQAGEDHPRYRNLVMHLGTLYPNISHAHIESLYHQAPKSAKRNIDDSRPDQPSSSSDGTSAQLNTPKTISPCSWSAKSTPAPKTLIVNTSSTRTASVQEIKELPESVTSSSDDEVEFSMFQCFPLLSILLDSWRTEATVAYIKSGYCESGSFEDSPHRSDIEYILQKINDALNHYSPNLSETLLDEIPNVIATFDISRKYGYRELMGQTNTIKCQRENSTWLSMGLVIYYAIAKFRYHDEIESIVRLGEKHTDLNRDSIENLFTIVSSAGTCCLKQSLAFEN